MTSRSGSTLNGVSYVYLSTCQHVGLVADDQDSNSLKSGKRYDSALYRQDGSMTQSETIWNVDLIREG